MHLLEAHSINVHVLGTLDCGQPRLQRETVAGTVVNNQFVPIRSLWLGLA